MCVREMERAEGAEGGRGREERTGVHNRRQETHTKMPGTIVTCLKFVTTYLRVLVRTFVKKLMWGCVFSGVDRCGAAWKTDFQVRTSCSA